MCDDFGSLEAYLSHKKNIEHRLAEKRQKSQELDKGLNHPQDIEQLLIEKRKKEKHLEEKLNYKQDIHQLLPKKIEKIQELEERLNYTQDIEQLLSEKIKKVQELEESLESRLGSLENQNFEQLLNEIRQKQQQLENRLQSYDTPQILIESAEEAGNLLQSQNFKERFCSVYAQLMTDNATATIDIVDILIGIGFASQNYPLIVAFAIIKLAKVVLGRYCQDFIDNH